MDKYDLIIAAIGIVLFLTVFFTLFAYLLGAYYWIRGKRANTARLLLRKTLDEKVEGGAPLLAEDIRPEWKRLDVALPVLFEMDDVNENNKSWRMIRDEFCQKALLPIARKHVGSFNMLRRLLAAKVFGMKCEHEDEAHVLKLLRDRTPLVHMEILLATPLIPTTNVVNTIIDMMATYRRKSYALYTETIRKMPDSASDAIIDRLRRENQPYVRSICYTLLMARNRMDPDIDLGDDLESEVLDLRISSVKYLARSRRTGAVEKLIEYLQDPEWQVRVVAVQELGRFKTAETRRHLVASLSDPKWWVRYNAGLSLKNMGGPGLEALKRLEPNDDRFAYETAQRLLVGHRRGAPEEA